uniref:Peroxyureidoacrylate/ureidoacrylate amidohydrolase RutB n=1 Tax=Candidatus Methanogaster sp. ANME-2c ERB4 TaxID=2759911 RepID=A0A7G9YQM1_9EURY|nr:peroxyureidoacrylate/ureidoacrylate amidohydrolase RutB [Methanosarcinales archaeon ANME-2c ERB4]QNO50305.1 peroxyureidoacrylate/ureidoacrylate amidohydrolase RutB [Methanosarcinales archaeon ANME-2c ERB4]
MPEVKINPEETALLLIDMQNNLLHEKGKAAALGVWKFAKEAGTIRNTRQMIEIARKNDIPLIYVKFVLRPDYADIMGLAQLSLCTLGKFIKEGEICKEGTWGAEYVDELKPGAGDYIVVKRRMDAFYNSDLETLLRGLGRRTLVICGIITNFCLESTVRGAMDRDFDCIVLEDCTASESREMQEFPMKAIFPVIGAVATSEELVIG